MTPVISVRGLKYQYDDGTKALDGVDFDLYPGECVALLGANGSGKTTFALHLNGLLQGEGSITVCGLPLVKGHLSEIRAKVGMVFQDSDEQLFMPSVIEDVSFGPLNRGLSLERATETAVAALRKVGLEYAAYKAPYYLSAGEKRRAAIAGVLAMEPEVLVLDEPTIFLDPPGQCMLTRLLLDLPQSKVVITHDVPFATALATRAVFFDRGRLAGEGSVEQIAERFQWRVDVRDLVGRPAGKHPDHP